MGSVPGPTKNNKVVYKKISDAYAVIPPLSQVTCFLGDVADIVNVANGHSQRSKSSKSV